MDDVKKTALRRLKNNRHHLTVQQYRTIKGQILAGCPDGAMVGLTRLLDKKVAKA